MIADRTPVQKAHAEHCRHCGRPLTRPGTVIPFVGTVGPECRHKFGPLLALVAEVEVLVFEIDDQGSQRLAHGIYSTLRRIGFDVTKTVDAAKGTLWLEISSRKVTRRGDAMLKTYEQTRAEFERRLKTAAAERAGRVADAPGLPVHQWGIARFRGQSEFLSGRGRIVEADALVQAYRAGGAA